MIKTSVMEIKRCSYYIRPMRKEDIPQVKEIDREVFPTQWPPPNYQRELQNQIARLIVACDKSKTVEAPELKVTPGKGISGLVSGIRWLFNHERFFGNKLLPSSRQYVVGFASIWVMANEAHITNIAVRNLYQRQGIGERLLISIIDLVAKLNVNIITLEVRVSNTPAHSLYNKYGFTQIGVRPGYYTDNREDALLMSTENITSASFQARFQQLKQAYSQRYGTANKPLTKISAR